MPSGGGVAMAGSRGGVVVPIPLQKMEPLADPGDARHEQQHERSEELMDAFHDSRAGRQTAKRASSEGDGKEHGSSRMYRLS